MKSFNGATQLRKLLQEPGLIVLPGAHDCLMAKLVEATGFPGAFIGDGAVSVTRLGRPDFGFVDLGEVVNRAREVCRSVSLPVVIDIGTGYGNPLNVQRTVSEIEATGAAGVFFEDQTWPKKCGHMTGRSLISQEEMAMKVRAAVDVRENDDFVVIARTDALATEGFEAAIGRLNAYGDAGADVGLIDALQSMEQLERAPRDCAYPMMANMVENGKTPYLSVSEVEQLGYKISIWPETLMYAGFGAMQRAAAELRNDGMVSQNTRDGMSDLMTLSNFLGLEEFYQLEKKYAHE